MSKYTFDIQLASLDAFADALGYKRDIVASNTYSLQYPINTGENFVRFSTMVKLHNAQWYYDKEDNVFYPHREKVVREKGKFLFQDFEENPFTKVFKLSAYEHRKAQSRKIVERVKIQANKHNTLVCQSDTIEFVADWYFEQFLGEE